MNSTTEGSKLYRGRVGNFTLLTDCSGIICFLGTMLVAYRFFVLCKRDGEVMFIREPSKRIKAFVGTLCFLECLHSISAHLAHFTTSAGLTFDVQTSLSWAMKMTFFTTVVITALCQAYIVIIVDQVIEKPRKKQELYFRIIVINSALLFFVYAIVAALMGQIIIKNDVLGKYFRLVTLSAGSWCLLNSIIQIDVASVFSRPHTVDVRRIFKIVFYLTPFFGLLPFIGICSYILYDSPPIFWAYFDLATFEVVGNVSPMIIIGLMCMPGFGTWERAGDITKLFT